MSHSTHELNGDPESGYFAMMGQCIPVKVQTFISCCHSLAVSVPSQDMDTPLGPRCNFFHKTPLISIG